MVTKSFMDGVRTDRRYQFLWIVLAVLFAATVAEELTDAAPSAVSLVIRSGALAFCLIVLSLSLVKARRQNRARGG